MATKKPVPPHRKQLRRHYLTVHLGHLIDDESHLLALSTVEEKNKFFRSWWDKLQSTQFPSYLSYIGASLELIPEFDKNGNPNAQKDVFHVHMYIGWKKPVRMNSEYPHLHLTTCPHTEVIGNPHAILDYCTASNSQSDKEHVEIWEYMPSGNRPFAGARSRQALTQDMIDRVKSGQGLVSIWKSNPRIIAHFGIKKLQEIIDLHAFASRVEKEGYVTGFGQGTDTVPIITQSPPRLYREGAAPRSERYSERGASRSRDVRNCICDSQTFEDWGCQCSASHEEE